MFGFLGLVLGSLWLLITLAYCNISDELKGSIQDVDATMRQIFTTGRRFDTDEKDAIWKTSKGPQYFMKEKVPSALLRKNNSSRSPDREPMDESPPKGRNRETNEGRSTVREVRRRERVPVEENARADESAEEVYGKCEPERETVTRVVI